jgi:DNA-binding winged helix-turn-helix (wHTH) protein/Tol biopolymer transport system component
MPSKASIFRFDDVEVREREFTLSKAGKVVAVEPKAFRALLFLLHNPQKVVSKEELLNSVWGDAAVTEGSLTRCIWLLRRVLGDDINEPRYIATVATVGYRFVGKVEVSEDAPGEPEAAEEPHDLSGIGTKVGSRKRVWGWALAGCGGLALCMAAAIWYLHRPLPLLRVTGYTQITHDGRDKTLVGTDGSRLYFNRMAGSTLPGSIAEVAISGGEIAPIPVALPNPLLVDVSPNGSSFLMSAVSGPQRGLWNVRILGGQARHLGDAYQASFSPDGNSVAFSAADGGIYVVGSDGTGTHKLAHAEDTVNGIAGFPVSDIAWPPDGGAIRFTMKDRIWEMSSGGSGLHEVMPSWHAAAECCGKWTSDGKLFLFISDGQIWARDERRGLFRRPPAEPIQITQGPIRWGGPLPGKYFPGEFWGRPVPSKDGSRIFVMGLSPRGELSRFDSKTKQFQPFLGGISAQGVSYSKDGKSIAYVSYPEGILWKANWDGSNPVQLTDPPLQAFMPRWSPDGKQISFAGDYPGPNGAFYIVSSDGGSPQKFVAEDQHLDGFLTWSPDGHRMAGTSTSADGKFVVAILNLDTRQDTIIPGSVDLFEPRWSPDGRYLVAASWEDSKLKVFDFETGKWSEPAQEGTADCPEWSGDSRFIYFRRVRGDTGLFRIRVSGGRSEKIVDLKDWHDAGWFGRYMGLDPTDAPLLLRDIGSEDIYALTLEQK